MTPRKKLKAAEKSFSFWEFLSLEEEEEKREKEILQIQSQVNAQIGGVIDMENKKNMTQMDSKEIEMNLSLNLFQELPSSNHTISTNNITTTTTTKDGNSNNNDDNHSPYDIDSEILNAFQSIDSSSFSFANHGSSHHCDFHQYYSYEAPWIEIPVDTNSIKSRKRKRSKSSNIMITNHLHNEISAFANFVSPSEKERKIRLQTVTRINKAVKEAFPKLMSRFLGVWLQN